MSKMVLIRLILQVVNKCVICWKSKCIDLEVCRYMKDVKLIVYDRCILNAMNTEGL